MSQLTNNTAALQALLEAVEALPAAGKGGVELDVIVAASPPASVTEGQIVVITETTPSTIYVDANEPTDMTAGDVWLQIGESEHGVELADGFRLSFSAAWQYYGTMWGALDGYVGINGAWQKFANSFPAAGTPLAQWTWSEIIALCNSGRDVTQYFEVGDTHELALTTGEVLTVAIGDFHHNTIAGTQNTAAIAFTMTVLSTTGYAMNSTNSNTTGWTSSAMRASTVPSVLNTFPAELVADDGIKTVDVLSLAGGSSSSLVTTQDRLRLHSAREVALTGTGVSTTEGEPYAFYNNTVSNRIKTLSNGSGCYWYTRTRIHTNSTQFAAVAPQGGLEPSNSTPARPVCWAFDI